MSKHEDDSRLLVAISSLARACAPVILDEAVYEGRLSIEEATPSTLNAIAQAFYEDAVAYFQGDGDATLLQDIHRMTKGEDSE